MGIQPNEVDWGLVANIGLGILGAVAVVAICAGTAGVGCVVAAVGIGTVTGGGGYALQQTINGEEIDSGELATSTALGAVLGLIPAGGGNAAKGIAQVGKAGLTSKSLGASVKNGDELVDLFRVVRSEELAGIRADGAYTMGPMNEVRLASSQIVRERGVRASFNMSGKWLFV